MKAPTVYTTFATDGTVRMALHKMDWNPVWTDVDSEEHEGLYDFRIVTRSPDMSTEWWLSCLGTDGYRKGLFTPLVGFSTEDYNNEEETCQAAIDWLLEGELEK